MRKLKKNEKIAIWIAVPVVLILLLGIGFLKKDTIKTQISEVIPEQTAEKDLDSLIVLDALLGEGKTAEDNTLVSVHYTGTYEDGTVFDSSVERGIPFTFILGEGQVIKGWDIGIKGMKVGGKRHLVIGPELAYGDTGVRNSNTGEYLIQPNTTLVFDVELIEVNEI